MFYGVEFLFGDWSRCVHTHQCRLSPSCGHTMGKKQQEEFQLNKKDEKKVQKLNSQIEYHSSRGEKEEAEKLRSQIEKIIADGKKAAGF